MNFEGGSRRRNPKVGVAQPRLCVSSVFGGILVRHPSVGRKTRSIRNFLLLVAVIHGNNPLHRADCIVTLLSYANPNPPCSCDPSRTDLGENSYEWLSAKQVTSSEFCNIFVSSFGSSFAWDRKQKRPEGLSLGASFGGSTPLGVAHRAEFVLLNELDKLLLLGSPVSDRTFLLSANIAIKSESTIVFLKKLLAS